ncbi:hypothetical protein H0A70_16490 [Alcaligenaceae bacterium]|nr:hypothetical protein [Alcaligenaceae bacterium]
MSKARTTTLSRNLFGMLAAAACLAVTLPVAAQSTTSGMDPQAQYRLDRERCNTGQTNQDKATCLREAGAALEEARRNRLMRGDASYTSNQTARCESLPAAQREDCRIQMSGQNTRTEGSVAGGGVLRETTITIPAAQ